MWPSDSWPVQLSHAAFTSYTSTQMGDSCGVHGEPCSKSIPIELTTAEMAADAWHTYRIDYDGQASPRKVTLWIDGKKVPIPLAHASGTQTPPHIGPA